MNCTVRVHNELIKPECDSIMRANQCKFSSGRLRNDPAFRRNARGVYAYVVLTVMNRESKDKR